jgi:chemotaxis response regulator CheB
MLSKWTARNRLAESIMRHEPGHRDIIVIGASAGGLQALQHLIKDLPADLPAAVFIVLHIGASTIWRAFSIGPEGCR